MRAVRVLALATVATSLACSEGSDPAQIAGMATAQGKPDLGAEQVCETSFPTGAYYSELQALCATTADANTLFLSRNNANQDRWALIGKLNRAGQKCSEDGNVAGAIEKLTDYLNQVIKLRSSGKIAEPDGVDLVGDAQDLIDAFNPDLTAPPRTCPSGDPAAG